MKIALSRNFYNQPINDPIKQSHEVREVAIGQGDYYTTRCLLHYAYPKDTYKFIAVDVSKQNALDGDPRATQRIVFQGVAGVKQRLYTVLEKSKEKVLEFNLGTAKSL